MKEFEYYKIVALEIKKLRLKKFITVKELSKSSRISGSTIYKLETGKYDFRIITLYKLCIGLQIKLTDFLKITDQEYDKQNNK